MTLPLKSFDTLVSDQVAAVQAASTPLINFKTGTVNLAQVEANSSMGVFLEFLIDTTLAITRAATSVGADLDSWMADFDFFRLAAEPANGDATFARFVTTTSTTIPVGTEIKDESLTQTYTVTEDTSHPNFNPVTDSYDVGVGVSSISVPITANVAGIQGNALANTITQLTSALAMDTVNNPVALTDGKNQESDPDFRSRFVDFINGLSKATKDAIKFAVESVQGVERFLLVENESFIGAEDLGFFYAVIDDGTGSPPASLISAVSAAVEDTRGLTIAFAVFAPVVLSVDISVDLTISGALSEAEVTNIVTTALNDYVNSIPIQDILPHSKVFEIIYDSTSEITNATNLLINGGTADLPSVRNQIFIPGTTTIAYIT